MNHLATIQAPTPNPRPVRPCVVLFAGGGSGGHISPGLAIAERLREVDPDSQCHFVCSQRAIDETMLSRAGETFTAIPATPPSVHPVRAMRFGRNFLNSRRIVSSVIAQKAITHMVALGGFVAVPAVYAARAAGIPVLMTNLDDPPGRANRWIAPRCTNVVTAIDLPGLSGFAQRVVGMPIRHCAIAHDDSAACRTRLGLEPDRLTLLITGASQGSTSINRFIMAMLESQPDMFRQCQVHHLSGGESEVEEIRRAYASANVNAIVEPFRHDMATAWGAASLAISRAGASSVAEAATNAVPCLFLPYPYHKDRHQANNARPLVELGGAVIETDHVEVAANVERIGPVLRDLMTDPERLRVMRTSLEANRPADAARLIAEMLCGNLS